MVRLKDPAAHRFVIVDLRFNSTMVRLKAGSVFVACKHKDLFQFHNGSIKSLIIIDKVDARDCVSIPQWFD